MLGQIRIAEYGKGCYAKIIMLSCYFWRRHAMVAQAVPLGARAETKRSIEGLRTRRMDNAAVGAVGGHGISLLPSTKPSWERAIAAFIDSVTAQTKVAQMERFGRVLCY
jgi:hypothetical protein